MQRMALNSGGVSGGGRSPVPQRYQGDQPCSSVNGASNNQTQKESK